MYHCYSSRRRFLTTLVQLAPTLLLAGCGGSSNSDSGCTRSQEESSRTRAVSPVLGGVYTLLQIGVALPQSSPASSLNDQGQVVYSNGVIRRSLCDQRSQYADPYLWTLNTNRQSGFTRRLSGDNRRLVQAINNTGLTGGMSIDTGSTPVQVEGVYLQPSVSQSLVANDAARMILSNPAIPAIQHTPEIRVINDRGDALVTSEEGTRLFTGGTSILLPNPDADSYLVGVSLDDSGTIAGYVQRRQQLYSVDAIQGFVYQNGKVDLLPLPTGIKSVQINDRNSAGQSVGIARSDDGMTRSFLLQGNDYQFIGPDGFEALAINSGGVVVGTVRTTAISRASVWRNNSLTALDDLIAGGSGWNLVSALAINQNGMILCDGLFNDRDSSRVLLVPA